MGKTEQKIKIAVIEDSDFTRKSIVSALEADYDIVAQAKTAQEAYHALQSSHADLFIIDVVMPEVSGVELAKKISEDMSSARIIMISSLNLESVVIESISSGAIDFLSKPFEMSELLNAIKKVEEEIRKDR